jgi:uncharacterized protein (TIGR00290 family)
MASKKKMTVSWSGGKDSAFALFKIMASGEYEVVSLHTVIDRDNHRVGLHGVREELIEAQAASLGFPLVKLYLPATNDHEAYASLMKSFYRISAADDITHVMFGDIFLEDLKTFREDLLKPSGLIPEFPLWQIDTRLLISDFIHSNFKTVICSADASLFSEEQVGITLDERFYSHLSPGTDPCGERGEFHTFVYDGPIFKRPIGFDKGEVVQKVYHYNKRNPDGTLGKLKSAFWFQDLLPRIKV